MKNNIRFDFITNTITVNKGYYEKVCMPGTDEHKEFMQLKADYPNMRIALRKVNAGNRKSTTKGLTYAYMRRFIALMDSKNLSTFDRVQLHYEMYEEDRTVVYHYVKDWFIRTYPYHKDMIVEAEPQATIVDLIPEPLLKVS